jgi:replicative DNA helicase
VAQGARELQQVRPNRIPPHNLDAEQSVLGAMLESQDAIANVVEILNPDDFYKPAHSEIYEAIMALFNRHEAIDAITVVEELSRRGTIEGIGGRPYILGLLEAYPTASSAARYARIVDELALLRRLIRAGNEVQEIGFAMPADVADAVDTAEGIIYEVGNRRLRDELHQLKALLGENMEQIEQLYERGEHITGISSGFNDLDDITAGFQKNNLIIIASRPAMGKSSLLNDFALAAALKRNNPVPTVIFTLEMSRHELVKRFLASEAKVDSQRINRGTLQEQDWGKLSGAMGRLAEAPIFIDDSANITLVEIRAKCRRLKAKRGLGLVIVDYLQLMQSPRKSENRQQEVSEISRNLKILARELEVPVLCASQLNRGVEMRADKRPLLGDLRESGCLTADTRIVRADTSESVSIGQLHEQQERNIPVWTLDEEFKLVRGTMTKVFSSGVKETFKLKLRSGREIRASANHPFLSFDGWKPLADLNIGEHLAVPRRLEEGSDPRHWQDAEVILLAHLIGDGCFVKRQPIHYTNQDPENLRAVSEAAESFGVSGRLVAQQTWWHLYLPAPYRLARGRRNPIAEWLDEFGLYGKRSREKFLPTEVFGLPDDQVTLFLRHLWATDGHVSRQRSNGVVLYYGTSSHRLAKDVQLLLLRLGISSCIRRQPKAGYHDNFAVHVRGATNQLEFLRKVGIHGKRGRAVLDHVSYLSSITPNPNVDVLPRSVWDEIRMHMVDQRVTTRQLARDLGMSYAGSSLYKSAPSRERLRRITKVIRDRRLDSLAQSGVFWDEVVEIVPDAHEEVFDATVPGTHNFVADGMIVHNSIEQDADLVMFLYRDEVYNRDSEARGEAELIVAKHRNGPTDTVKLAFMNQYTKFASLTKGPR